jgi:itaconate CoA-transferase
MYAYSSILSALLLRERTGRGSHIDVSMLESLNEWMGYPLYYTHFGGKAPRRAGTDHATIVPYGRFRTGDDSFVMFGIQNEREWVSFCAGVLKQPLLAKDARYDSNTKRTAARAEVIALIERAFSELTAGEVVERLDASGIANARLNSPEEVWKHPQLEKRNRWREVASPAGPLPAVLPPASFDGVEPRMDPIPEVGEHPEAILAELGLAAADIARLKAEGAV